MEIYQAFADYHTMMDLTEQLLAAACLEVCGDTRLTYQGEAIDLTPPWRRVTMHELVEQATGLDFSGFSDRAEAVAAMEAAGLAAPEAADSVGRLLVEAFEQAVETTLVQPTFVMDYPVENSPLARAHRSKPGMVERFELFIVGRETANAFSELIDPSISVPGSSCSSCAARRGPRSPDGGRGFSARPGGGHAPHRRPRHRHRSPRHAAHRQPLDPRCDRLPPAAPGGPRLGRNRRSGIMVPSRPSPPRGSGMSGERVGFRFQHADAVVKRNPQGRSRRGWVMEPVEQTTSRGTKMPAYRIRWRDSERPEIVLQHMLIADPDPTPPPEGVSLVPPAPKK